MEIKVYFHTKFNNGNGDYVKVAITLDETMAFGAIIGKEGKVQAQKFPVCKPINIVGLSKCGLYIDNELTTAWTGLAQDTKNAIIACVEQLPRSFQRLCENVVLNQQVMIDVHNHIRMLKRTLADLNNGIQQCAPQASEAVDEWRRVDITQLDLSDAQNLLDELTVSTKPNNVIVKATSAYRVVNGVIESRPATTSEIAEANAKEFERQRRKINMAMFKPGKAIGEFEEGNLYACKRDGGPCALLQINGQTRKIRWERLNCYEVYADAPALPENNAQASETPLFA